MDAMQVIRMAASQGVTLYLEKDVLAFKAKAPLTDEFRQAVSSRKADIIALLQKQDKPDTAKNDLLPDIQKAKPAQNYPVSIAQQALLLIEKLNGDSAQYMTANVYELPELLSLPHLEQAIRHLIVRHEILRTKFVEQEGEFKQQVLSELDVKVCFQDLSQDISSVLTKEQLIRDFCHQSVSAFAPVLHKYLLLHLSGQKSQLVICFHHVLMDGVSSGMFIRQLAETYQLLLQGTTGETAANSVQYKDYSLWMEQLQSHSQWQKQAEFWKEYLSEAPKSSSMPGSAGETGPDLQNNAEKFEFVRIPMREDVATQIRRAGQQFDCTGFMFCFAVFSLLVCRFSWQKDLVIGTPVGGRIDPQLQNMLGMFANMLPVRFQIQPEQRKIDFMQAVKSNLLNIMDKQLLPFEKIVEQVAPHRNMGQNPIFQLSFAYVETPTGLQSEVFNNVSQEFLPSTKSKFDLGLQVLIEPGQNELLWSFSRDKFNDVDIVHFSKVFFDLVTEFVNDAGASLADLSVADELLYGVAAMPLETAGQDSSILSELSVVCEKCDSRTAIYDADSKISFAMLDEMSTQLAKSLIANGIKKGEVVAVSSARNSMFPVIFYGILKSGAVYLPVDLQGPLERQKMILQNSHCVLLIYQEQLEEFPYWAQSAHRKVVNLGELRQHNQPIALPEISADDLAYIIFTSGSTGTPKGVQMSHAALCNFAQNMTSAKLLGQSSECVWAGFAEFVFDASLQYLVQSVNGNSIRILSEKEKKNVDCLKQVLQQEQIDVLDCTPSTFIWWSEKMGVEALPHLVIGGEAISDSLWRKICRWREGSNKRAWNAYGPTECCVNTSMALIEDNISHLGEPLNGVHLKIIDVLGLPAITGGVGELHIAGKGVAKGYINASQYCFYLGTDALVYYRSGDLVRQNQGGKIQYVGRVDQQLKINGIRFEPGEIENALEQVEQITQCRVALLTTQPITLVAAIVTNKAVEDKNQWAISLFHQLQSRLPTAAFPNKFLFFESIPLNQSGKLNTQELMRAYKENNEDFTLQLASTDTEQSLINIWHNLLQRQVDVQHSFFEMGGNSLMMNKALNDISLQFGLKIPLKDLFLNQNIVSLAAHVDSLLWLQKSSQQLNQVSTQSEGIIEL